MTLPPVYSDSYFVRGQQTAPWHVRCSAQFLTFWSRLRGVNWYYGIDRKIHWFRVG